MSLKNIDLILASGSPRRRELLAQAGYEYTVITSDVDETTDMKIPKDYVMELAHRKAADIATKELVKRSKSNSVSDSKAFVVIGADTVVALNDRILGKPLDYDDAYNTIQSLAGQTHQVYTGVSLIYFDGKQSHTNTFYECTEVSFYPMTHDEIVWYLSMDEDRNKAEGPAWCKTQPVGSWKDKAGSYGIQDPFGMTHIKEIKGDYYNVVGLPLARLCHELEIIYQAYL